MFRALKALLPTAGNCRRRRRRCSHVGITPSLAAATLQTPSDAVSSRIAEVNAAVAVYVCRVVRGKPKPSFPLVFLVLVFRIFSSEKQDTLRGRFAEGNKGHHFFPSSNWVGRPNAETRMLFSAMLAKTVVFKILPFSKADPPTVSVYVSVCVEVRIGICMCVCMRAAYVGDTCWLSLALSS